VNLKLHPDGAKLCEARLRELEGKLGVRTGKTLLEDDCSS
jgi:hypothetical protein